MVSFLDLVNSKCGKILDNDFLIKGGGGAPAGRYGFGDSSTIDELEGVLEAATTFVKITGKGNVRIQEAEKVLEDPEYPPDMEEKLQEIYSKHKLVKFIGDQGKTEEIKVKLMEYPEELITRNGEYLDKMYDLCDKLAIMFPDKEKCIFTFDGDNLQTMENDPGKPSPFTLLIQKLMEKGYTILAVKNNADDLSPGFVERWRELDRKSSGQIYLMMLPSDKEKEAVQLNNIHYFVNVGSTDDIFPVPIKNPTQGMKEVIELRDMKYPEKKILGDNGVSEHILLFYILPNINRGQVVTGLLDKGSPLLASFRRGGGRKRRRRRKTKKKKSKKKKSKTRRRRR